MKLRIANVGTGSNQSTAIVEHNGVELEWNMKVFDKAVAKAYEQVFDQLNAYWATLPEATQLQIWNVYDSMHLTFDTVFEQMELHQALLEDVATLIRLHDLDQMRHWLDFYSGLHMPSLLEDNFDETNDTGITREKTYLRDDYRWLVVMSIVMRAMLPVWGEYISRIFKEAGAIWKEHAAFMLLNKTDLMTNSPLVKLNNYVQQWLPEKDKLKGPIMAGISSEDFPTWILSLVVVRRLPLGNLNSIDPKDSLVKYIYHYVQQKIRSSETHFTNNTAVKDKIIEGQSSDAEGNLSVIEGYKIKQEIPEGDIAIIEHFAMDTKRVILRLEPEIDLNLLAESERSVLVLMENTIHQGQLKLAQWVLSSVIPARSLEYLSKPTIVRLIAVTQAVLWHRKHFELAGLASAKAVENTGEIFLGGVPSRTKVTPELTEKLNKLYPHVRRTSQRRAERPRNIALLDIDRLDEWFSERDWVMTLPGSWVEKLTGNSNNRRLAVPMDIRVRLAELIIQITERKARSAPSTTVVTTN